MLNINHPHLTPEGYWDTHGQQPRMVIFSGAGLSQDSGLDVFRGDGGLWESHRIEDVCNGLTWRKNRELVDRFYADRLVKSQTALPHDGHAWCVEKEREGAVLLTQNVDSLLERAGARHVMHLHGRLDMRTCWACSYAWAYPVLPQKECPVCMSEDTRVGVVFFNEPAPIYMPASRVISGLKPQDVLVVVGTAGKVVNPLRWLTSAVNIWVVDPDPSPYLLTKSHTQTFKAPAKALREHLEGAWQEHLGKAKARG